MYMWAYIAENLGSNQEHLNEGLSLQTGLFS